MPAQTHLSRIHKLLKPHLVTQSFRLGAAEGRAQYSGRPESPPCTQLSEPPLPVSGETGLEQHPGFTESWNSDANKALRSDIPDLMKRHVACLCSTCG